MPDNILKGQMLMSQPASQQKNRSELWGDPRSYQRKLFSKFFHGLLILSVSSAILLLLVLLMEVFIKGSLWLSWDFLFNFPSRFPSKAGLKSAIFGSFWLVLLTASIAIPIGVGAAVFLEEYAQKSKIVSFIEINIGNLAGVPSIIYGLLGLVIFVRVMGFGSSLISGALTMSLLILPVIIVSSREALKSVPQSIRLAAYALGATKWQTIRSHVIPASLPGILTGVILSLSRSIGETAPLIMVGAVGYIAFIPESILSSFTVLPIQIYDWTSRPQEDFHHIAAAGIIVLLALLLSMNALAIFIRNKYQKRLQW